jgi:hypothetical protein
MRMVYPTASSHLNHDGTAATSCRPKNFPVIDRSNSPISLGLPSNNTSPPALPPSGPRSVIQSVLPITGF